MAKRLVRQSIVSDNLFGQDAFPLIQELEANRDIFSKSLDSTEEIDARLERQEGILSGDSDILANVIRSAFGDDTNLLVKSGAKTNQAIMSDGMMTGEYKEVNEKGWVIDPVAGTFKKVEGAGIRAILAYDALAVLLTAYGLCSSLRFEPTDIKYGLWARPTNCCGDVLYGNDYKVFLGDLSNKSALGYGYKDACDHFRFRALEVSNLLATKTYNKITCAGLKQRVAESLGCEEKNIKHEAKKLVKGVSTNEVVYSLAIYHLAISSNDAEIRFIAPKSAKAVYETLGLDEVDSIYFMQDQGIVYFDWYADMEDSIFAATLFKFASKKAGSTENYVTLVENDENVVEVFFEENFVTIKEDGVYDHRGRRFMNLLVADRRSQDVVAGEDDVILINSHQSFLLCLVNSLWYLRGIKSQGHIKAEPVAQWFRHFTDIIPMDSEEESGALNVGLRGEYNRVATQAYVWRGLLPFGGKARATVTGLGESHGNSVTGQFVKFSSLKNQLTKAVLSKYNMVQVHKGNMSFMDASWVMLRGSDLPKSIARELVTYVITKIYGKSLRDGLMELYFNEASDAEKLLAESCKDDENKLLTLFIEFGNFPLSTKVAKITKRITLAMPSSAEPIGGVMRAFFRLGSLSGADIGHRYTAGVFPHLINSPGVMWQLCARLKPFIVKQNNDVNIECFEKDSSKWVYTYRDGVETKKGTRMSYSYRGVESKCTSNGAHYGISHSGKYFAKDDVIVEIPYQVGDETCYKVIAADEDCWVKEIQWWFIEIGGQQILTIRILWEDVQFNAKLRQTFKALVSRPSSVLWSDKETPELIYNELNAKLDKQLGKKLPASVDIISTGDSDKSKDLLMGLLDIAAETEVANGRATQLAPLNKLVGVDRTDLFVYHEVLALAGKYDKFMGNFIESYGRPVWFYNRDAGDAMLRAVRELYTNKSEGGAQWIRRDINWLHANCPETIGFDFGKDVSELTIVTSNMTKDKNLTQYDEVFVFGKSNFTTEEGLELPEFIWQRSFGFIGTDEDQVYINAKVELCSVDQSVSTSPLMSAVARCVNVGIGDVPGDYETAKSLMDSSTRIAADHLKAVHSMVNNYILQDSEGEFFNEVKLFEDGKISDDALDVLEQVEDLYDRAKAGDRQLIHDLAKVSETTVFYLTEDVYLYLPAILKQSRNSEARQSLTATVADLFNYAINGVEMSKCNLAIRGIVGSLKGLIKSKNLLKAVFMGRKSSQTKAVGVWGIPLTSYVVIEGSPAFKEYVRAAVDNGIIENLTQWRKLVGERLLLSRAPLPFPTCLRFMPVEWSHPLARLINSSQAGVNPLVAYCSAGDFDGDNYPTTSLDLGSNYPLITYDTLMEIIQDRTGVPGVSANQKAYIADHFIPKGWKKHQVINPTLIQPKNIGILTGVMTIDHRSKVTVNKDDYDPMADTCPANGRYAFDSMMAGSTEMQELLVGATHKIAVVCEIANGMARVCYDALEAYYGEVFVNEFDSSYLSALIILAIYELYEGGTLGGLSWEAYYAIKLLYTATLKPIEAISLENGELSGESATEFINALGDASINTRYATNYLEVAVAIRQMQEMIKIKSADLNVGMSEAPKGEANFLVYTNEERGIHFVTGNLSGRQLVEYASYLLYELCGGRFEPEVKTEDGVVTKVNGHAALALLIYNAPQDLWKEMSKTSVAVNNLNLFLDELLPLYCPELCLDLCTHEFYEDSKGKNIPIFTLSV